MLFVFFLLCLVKSLLKKIVISSKSIVFQISIFKNFKNFCFSFSFKCSMMLLSSSLFFLFVWRFLFIVAVFVYRMV